MPPLNIIFAGTPDFAARHLDALLQSEHKICAVYTQPDRPAGRGKKLSPSSVKSLALDNNLQVLQPVNLKSAETLSELRVLNCDIMVVVAYGLILPKEILDTPKYGCINVHASLLPRWRGAAPIHRAIELGDSKTGVTIMQMDVGLDTGDMLLKSECPILPDDTTAILHDRLCDIGPPSLIQVLDQISSGNIEGEPQDHTQSNYAAKIIKSEAEIQWTESADIISRKIRAFNPFPIAFTILNGERLRIHRASLSNEETNLATIPGSISVIGDDIFIRCGENSLKLERLQIPGKKATSAKEFLNGFGHLLAADTQLGNK